jgi:hypothetical protein
VRISTEPAIEDWDSTIARAMVGPHAEDKLRRTVELLTAAMQRSRLRGDTAQLESLRTRLGQVLELLDYV